ncbi:hypothetical protein [Agrobacterium tumefaciens]|jgi:hypothetical protein|uniref:hypothetical protein n=1 Tax=Agrobacterium tumefaciens TaxID=358 RepID=UPI001572C07E|nr:hypothetical protein [Agrobacterium tumefaciens]
MAVANLTVSRPVIPQPDHSWLDNLAGNLQSVAVNAGAGKIINEDLAARGLAPAPASGGGFLGKLLGGGNQQQPQATFTGPVTSQQIPGQPPASASRASLQGGTYKPFIETVRAGGLTNPYGLAAVASTGKAESGWSAANANRTWSDPSESGQPGTAGGIMSWRGPRYQALAATGDLSPEGQARFFLQEDPNLIQALNNARSVEEAQQLMNRAWAFAGHDRPGGEAARRMAMAQNYYANEFRNAPPPNAGAAAIEAVAPLEQGDTSGNETAYVDPMVKVEPRADAAPYTMASPTAPGQPSGAPMQVADSSGRVISQPQSQPTIPVNADLIRRMVQNPITRERGLALWQQATEGRKMGFDFMLGQNGDLIRTDNQGGASVVGNFAKPDRQGLVNAGNGVLYDPNSKEWITSPNAGQQFRQATPEEATKYGAQAGQFGPDGKFYPINPPSGTSLQVDPTTGAVTFNQGAGVKPLTEGQSKDTVYSTRATAAMPLLNKHEGALLSLGETLANGIPLNLGNYAQTEEFQLARDAGKDFLASILRKDTGAAVTKSEEDLYGRIFLPQPGDKPATVDAKRQRRALAVEAIKAGMPPQAIANMGKALENASAYEGETPSPTPSKRQAASPAPGANTTYPRAKNPRTGAMIELRNGKWEEVR